MNEKWAMRSLSGVMVGKEQSKRTVSSYYPWFTDFVRGISPADTLDTIGFDNETCEQRFSGVSIQVYW